MNDVIPNQPATIEALTDHYNAAAANGSGRDAATKIAMNYGPLYIAAVVLRMAERYDCGRSTLRDFGLDLD